MSQVLVTGASGFIGLPVLARLAQTAEQVHAITTRSEPPMLPGVRWHRVDLADSHAVVELMAEIAPERLIHMAWCTDVGHYWRAPENVDWVQRSLHLMRAFVRHGGQRMVMLGTCAEYDWSTVTGPLGEHNVALAPATLYGVAKDALRRTARAYAEQQQVELAWGRLFFLYGPREAPGRLVSSIISSLLAGQTVETTAGEQIRDFMHVEDAGDAVVALLDSAVLGEVNIASGHGVSVGQVIEEISLLIGRPELVHRGALPERPGDPSSLVADIARLRNEVGYHPRWPLAEGLAQTVRWWDEHRG